MQILWKLLKCVFFGLLKERGLLKQISWYFIGNILPVKEVFCVHDGSSIQVNQAMMAMQASTGTIIKKKELNKAIIEAFGDVVTCKTIKVGSRIGGEDKRAAVYPSYFMILLEKELKLTNRVLLVSIYASCFQNSMLAKT